MIKLIASDMDGTLLNDHIDVSLSNAQAIKLAQAKGLHFLIATGRDYPLATHPLKDHNIECPIITLNGAQLFDKEGKNLYNKGLEKNVVKKIRSIISQYSDVHEELMTSDGIYSSNREERLKTVASMLADLNPDLTFEDAMESATAHVEEMNIKFVDSLDSVVEDNHIVILKVSAHSEEGPAILKPLKEQLANEVPKLAITASSKKNIEINHESAQKGIAIAQYAKKLGIKAEEVMTIGDNINDLSMLTWAKYGTAVANAVPEAKEAASYSTSSNSQNGVAEAISRVLNGKIYKD
ncbi:Cof-type HAD-IIB family hydrolase [Marinilactibacillus psychrotolerans]|uniref:Cof-type HAD-IIB family hydrolase n=2 Tax=Marinilactibacillus psychrotolerans TaxID=191770 RepID=A0A5R9C252_9LACT|nr:Cof-type HAD-IIB family hydrolase [Marinilactibacillus psychrotolerans]TLQ06808.1 Cof-type HAD-IIB family hydrolase [Marinilactibacillus psychrotolerans]GEQ32501.1 haloacid dehalogenase [Marinilactibacillus psychrotolerans]SJN41436.1 Hydrolase (HAD superfamily) [Marinilactibacillus psychrotolerans 42ea]